MCKNARFCGVKRPSGFLLFHPLTRGDAIFRCRNILIILLYITSALHISVIIFSLVTTEIRPIIIKVIHIVNHIKPYHLQHIKLYHLPRFSALRLLYFIPAHYCTHSPYLSGKDNRKSMTTNAATRLNSRTAFTNKRSAK